MSEQRFAAETAPATPPTGYVTIYPKASDKRMYGKDDAGNEFSLGAIASTDALPEGVTNLYFTDERAQDAVGSALTDSSNIDFTYNDAGNTITADLTNSGVSAGTYGNGTNVPQVTVDAKGRVTSVSNVAISSLTSTDFLPEGTTNLYFTDERAQDAVGSILGDSSSIDFLYNDAGNSITASVLPDGVGSFSTLAEQYGFPTTSDTLVQILSKLAYSQSLQKRVISTNAVIPDGHVWLRGETRITGTANVRLLGDSNMRFI